LGALQSNKIAGRALRGRAERRRAHVKELERLARIKPGATIDVQVDFTGRGTAKRRPPVEVGVGPPRARTRTRRARTHGDRAA
jgi:hypothetical protein